MQIFDLLKKRLQKDLPGSKAHFEMVPASRLNNPRKANSKSKKSAVLLMIYEKIKIPYIVLIIRAKGSNPHSGQISFPGGKYEKFDDSIVDTALREANEEIGVNIDNLKVIGQLTNIYIPVSDFIVYPIVAFHQGKLNLKANKSEVSEILEVPISDFLDAKNKGLAKVDARGTLIDAPVFNIQNKKIWGATAMILNEFIYILKS